MSNVIRCRLSAPDCKLAAVLSGYMTGETLDFQRVIPNLPALATGDPAHFVWERMNKELWGCKSNVANGRVEPDGSLYFETSWYPPTLVIRRLSQHFPKLTFKLDCSAESGVWIGTYSFQNGKTC